MMTTKFACVPPSEQQAIRLDGDEQDGDVYSEGEEVTYRCLMNSSAVGDELTCAPGSPRSCDGSNSASTRGSRCRRRDID